MNFGEYGTDVQVTVRKVKKPNIMTQAKTVVDRLRKREKLDKPRKTAPGDERLSISSVRKR